MSTATENQMSLEELQRTRQWNGCTQKQKKWLVVFIESNGDIQRATKAAYNPKNDLNAQILSYKIRAQKDVASVLRLYYPDYGERDARDESAEREAFLAAMKKKLLKSFQSLDALTVSEKDLVKALFEARGWAMPDELHAALRTNGYKPHVVESPAQSKCQVGDIRVQNGNRFRVDAVDANGKITQASPIKD